MRISSCKMSRPNCRKPPGKVESVGPELGAHNDLVYGELLGMDSAKMADLQDRGII